MLPDQQDDGVGHGEGQVACGDAVTDPQQESDQQDREISGVVLAAAYLKGVLGDAAVAAGRRP
jgi:hypothetical protein